MLDLRALEEIQKNPSISQRDLARRMGVALGFANACLKNMARRGYIKLKKARGNNLSYLITPDGLKAKATLTARAFSDTVAFYAGAKEHIRAFFQSIAEQGVRSVVFFGIDDLLDIIFIVAQEFDFKVLAVVDADGGGPDKYMKYPVVAPERLKALRPDMVILSSLRQERKMKTTLKKLKLDLPAATIFDMHWGGRGSDIDQAQEE